MNKGFTLIEMLATIAILGILVSIVLVSANRLITSSNLEYYNTSEKMMILASKDYFADYRSYLPKEVNGKTRVLLSALVTEEYIDMIKDVNENDCNDKESYVEVEKISNSEFLYKAHLVCDKAGYITSDGDVKSEK